jgi:hypothetical protein
MNDDIGNQNTNINIFSWDKFPVESDKFRMCICLENEIIEDDNQSIKNLIEYNKLLFPENIIYYKTIQDLIYYKKQSYNIKSTVLIDLRNNEKNKNKTSDLWLENLYMMILDLESIYCIIIGEYSKVPKIILTVSDIIIFDTTNTINKYLSERHNSKLSNFDVTEKYYLMVDKRRMDFKIQVLEKSKVNRYF